MFRQQVCAARDTHGRSLEDVRRAIEALEPPPPAFLQLDLSALFGDQRAAAEAAATAAPAAAPAEQPQQVGRRPIYCTLHCMQRDLL